MVGAVPLVRLLENGLKRTVEGRQDRKSTCAPQLRLHGSSNPFEISPMTDSRQEIADLEAEIDALSFAVEQCRKSMIVAKVAVVGGLLVFGASLLGLLWSDPIALVVGIAAILAGIAFYGSSRGSLEQVTEKIKVCEARRAEIIDGMDLQPMQER